MAIKARNITAKDRNGEAVNLSGDGSKNFGNSHAFTIIPAGYRTAVIENVKSEVFRMTVGGYPCDFTDDEKWPHLRLTPKFRLLNDEASIISKQSFIVGALDSLEPNASLLAPNPDNDVVWGGMRGARDFLQALKLFTEDGEGGFNLTLHAPAIRNMAVRVLTSVGGYKKGTFDIPPMQMLAKLNEHSESVLDFSEAQFDIEAINAAITALNEAEGLTEENGYKLKNVIVKIQPLWANKAEDEGLFAAYNLVDDEKVLTGQVFTDEDAAEAYVNAMYDADLADGF